MSQIESLSQIEENLENLSLLANENINKSQTNDELDELRVALLGKKGELSMILKNMGKLSSSDRRFQNVHFVFSSALSIFSSISSAPPLR